MTSRERARAEWAQTYINRANGQEIPAYGSPEWLEADPVLKVASACRAAEAWATDGETLPERMQAFGDAAWLASKQAEDAEWREDVAEHRRRWQHTRSWNLPGAYAGQGEPRPLGEALREYVDEKRARREGGGTR